MTGNTALFVARDGSDNGTTPVGARLALGGLLAGNGASPLDVRAGVLADNGGAIVSGTANMSYDVRAFRAVSLVSTANGPTIGANDASVNVATTAAPGSNSRIDVIWARQHHVSGDGGSDSDVVYEIGVTQGTVAASPTAPAVPTGAVALYNATVTAGVTATSGLTFTRAHAWTVAKGGVIPIFTSGERSAISPYEGCTIYYSPLKQVQVWNGTAWAAVGQEQANPIAVYALSSSFAVANTTDVVISTLASRSPHHNPGTGYFAIASGVVTCTKAGLYRVSARARWDTGSSSGYRRLLLKVASTTIVTSELPGSSEGGPSNAIEQVISLTAGQTLSLAARRSGGGTVGLMGDANEIWTSLTIEYLGVAAA